MNTVHIISHTHWDREWYRTYQQFRLRLVHLIDNLLAILKNDPDFLHFMLDGQTIILEDYLEIRPDRASELRQYILDGQLLIGPWYILPDEFLVSPEATVRNLLEGDRQCKQWGAKMNVGYTPDAFGHIGQLPQILRGFEIDSACLWRGLDDQPCELWWQSADGSRVLLANLRNSYSNGASLPAEEPQLFFHELQKVCDDLKPYTFTAHYLVMLGTDHMEPPAATSQAIRYANQIMPSSKVVHSTLPAYIEAIKQEIPKAHIPVVIGELRSSKRAHLLPGVLSTRMWIKQRNHACETLLERWAEPFSAWAGLVWGDAFEPHPPYQASSRLADPTAALHYAWKLLMKNHPHDSICGCSIDPVHEEMRTRFDQVEQIGEEIVQQSLDALSAAVATEHIPAAVGAAQLAVVVFNAAPNRQSGVVDTALVLPQDVTSFELVDAEGKAAPYLIANRASAALFDITMPAEDFKNAIRMIKDGKVMNLVIREMNVMRQGNHAEITLVMANYGEANTEAWQLGAEAVQRLLSDSTVAYYHVLARSADELRLVFLARDIPAQGYATFWLRKAPPVSQLPVQPHPLFKLLLPIAARLSQSALIQRLIQPRNKPRSQPPYIIENEFFQLEASARDGTLTLWDKRTGRRYPGLNRFVDGGDCGDEYNYSPPEHDWIISSTRLVHVQIEKNALEQRMILDMELEIPAELADHRRSRSRQLTKNHIRSSIRLIPGVERIEIQTEIENMAKDHRLRVHFPTPFQADKAYYDGHFEIVQRPTSLPAWDETWVEQPRPEVPQRAFTAVRQGDRGMMIANRGLPEVEVIQTSHSGAEIALTLLRCVGWLSRDDFQTRRGHAGPFIATPGAQMQGKFTFDYAIIPFSGGEAGFVEACHQAYSFQTPLRAHAETLHPGQLPATTSLIEVSSPEFIISAIKISEQKSADQTARWIVRGYNPTDEAIEVKLRPWRRAIRADLVNLAEAPLVELSIQEDDSVIVHVAPNEIKTVQWTFSKTVK